MSKTSDEILLNYRTLVDRVDELCRRISEEFQKEISCRKGCDGCCRHLTLFPVEATALASALAKLPEEEASYIRQRASGASPDSPCPLLDNGACLLYAARPVICRTHGLPLLTVQEETRTVDFCPENFRGVKTLPGSAVIDLERLNAALATVNDLYLADQESASQAERITIAAALLRDR